MTSPSTDIFPLSPAQQGMLLLTLAESDPALHLEQSCVALNGPIDSTALEAAWQWALDRHPMLRTAFTWKDLSQPLQAVVARACVPFQIFDWREVGPQQRRTRLEAFLATDRQKGVALSDPPLMRVTLVRLEDAEARLIWTRHRALLDGWSTACLMREVELAYLALSRGQTPVTSPPGAYKDFVTWLHRQDWAAAESFWRTTLQGIESPTPVGRASSAFAERGIAAVAGHLPASTLPALTSLSRERRLTLNTLLQGAWAMLLSRYCDRSEVLFGTTVAGRPSDLPNIDTTLGFFINTLPMRVTVPSDTGLGSWLAGLQAQHLELRRFEHCSAGQVRGWSNVPGALPLYESVLVFQNYPGHISGSLAPANRADEFGSVGLHRDYALTIHAVADAELALTLVFDTARFHKVEIERVLSHFIALLERIALNPPASIGQLLETVPKNEIQWTGAMPIPVRPGNVPLTAPRTDVERTVASIWRELLGVPEIGIEDNFFALRGHSLLAMRLISRIYDAFQIEIPLSRLFASPTIAGLSAAIEEAILTEIEALSEEEAQRQASRSATQRLEQVC